MRFCPKCGTAVIDDHEQSYAKPSPQAEVDSRFVAEEKEFKKIVTDEAVSEPFAEPTETDKRPDKHKPSKLKKWWAESSTPKKVLGVIAAAAITILAAILLISFLREFGYLLLGLLIVAVFVFSIVTGTKEERSEAKKTVIHIVLWGAAIIVAAVLLATKGDFFSDLLKPGAGVREAYLTQYSEDVTVEEAFDGFFDQGKWSTYKENGYSYVAFNGVCEYLGEKVDARVIFKITGENFVVDQLDINGVEQNDLILYALLAKVYESY